MHVIVYPILFAAVAVAAVGGEAISYYSNKVLGCHLNLSSKTLLCTSSVSDKSFQLDSVNQVISCEYHLCASFTNQPDLLSCSGYIWSIVGAAKSSQYLNPLAPTSLQVAYHVQEDETVELDQDFMGYNLIISTMEYEVETRFTDANITALSCKDPYSTCVTLNSSSPELCFGATGHTLHDNASSFFIGLAMTFCTALMIYIPILACEVGDACTMVAFVVPALVLAVVFIILIRIENLIIKNVFFGSGLLVGMVLGLFVARAAIILFQRKCMGRVRSATTDLTEATVMPLDIETKFSREYPDEDDKCILYSESEEQREGDKEEGDAI